MEEIYKIHRQGNIDTNQATKSHIDISPNLVENEVFRANKTFSHVWWVILVAMLYYGFIDTSLTTCFLLVSDLSLNIEGMHESERLRSNRELSAILTLAIIFFLYKQ